MAGVILKGVRKCYDDVQVIENLDLEIKDHEFMVLVGPSGCGKSTALRMIAGLEEITDGTIHIGGKEVNDLAPKDRDIAMVFQSYALYPHMSVRQNLDFGLRIRKMDKAEIDRRVNEVAATLGIEDYLDRKPRQLSGGQRQRVAVGRAIVRQPRVFLFDEPLSNLDAKLRVQMRAEITSLQRRLNTTTIYVTHDQVEAMTMGHRIAVLNEGDLMQVGTPLELYEAPANLFVANFIGTPPMNFLSMVIANDGTELRGKVLTLPVSEQLRPLTRGGDGRQVMVGMRPEHLHESPPDDDTPSHPLEMKVDLLETLGHEVLAYGLVGDERLGAKLSPHTPAQLDSSITLYAELNLLHIFDIKTEKRLTSQGETS